MVSPEESNLWQRTHLTAVLIFSLAHSLSQRVFWVLAGWVVVGPLSFMTTLDKLKVTNRLAILCVHAPQHMKWNLKVGGFIRVIEKH